MIKLAQTVRELKMQHCSVHPAPSSRTEESHLWRSFFFSVYLTDALTNLHSCLDNSVATRVLTDRLNSNASSRLSLFGIFTSLCCLHQLLQSPCCCPTLHYTLSLHQAWEQHSSALFYVDAWLQSPSLPQSALPLKIWLISCSGALEAASPLCLGL